MRSLADHKKDVIHVDAEGLFDPPTNSRRLRLTIAYLGFHHVWYRKSRATRAPASARSESKRHLFHDDCAMTASAVTLDVPDGHLCFASTHIVA